eukprot:gnl/Spiro4/14448_TR7782_c0_g1_i1.p3 gnl/Spiro4/14448_TR7782_c0_g1~~gnl/Spiro4/14448_TR7782_c0_g1_i1.p3  ORF type:complete len:177 (-),score=0.01 gnl/Spiro4/14448_TR7782_c0_g1_i1:615-1145(-)
MSTATSVYQDPALTIQQILMAQLGLSNTQVMYTNEKWNIPTVGPLVLVSYLGPSKVICTTDSTIPTENGLTELQTVTVLDTIEVQVFGYNTAQIRSLRNQIQVAFNSLNSQALQEKWQIQIARNPGTMTEASYLEGTSMVTRYITTVQVTSINQFTPPVPDYYDIFTIPPPVTVNA